MMVLVIRNNYKIKHSETLRDLEGEGLEQANCGPGSHRAKNVITENKTAMEDLTLDLQFQKGQLYGKKS